MMARKDAGKVGYLIATNAVAVVLVLLLLRTYRLQTPLQALIRGSSLLGYLAMFASIVGSAFQRQARRLFGRSFGRVHHLWSVAGLVLLTIHPLAVALEQGTLAVFVPRGSSAYIFFSSGGAPALYLFALAAALALPRALMRRGWRALHWLTYVGFWLGTAHAFVAGKHFGQPAVLVAALLMMLVVAAVFVRQRLPRTRR